MLWKFSSVYDVRRLYAEHLREVRYELPVPDHRSVTPRDARQLYVHTRLVPADRGRPERSG
jgi:hypothetical protein